MPTFRLQGAMVFHLLSCWWFALLLLLLVQAFMFIVAVAFYVANAR